MTERTDTYEILAKYYDGAYGAKKDLVDLPFYMDLAKRIGGPVLEIACGTGRVLLPIAREGVDIHGIDNSPAMLAILREHLKNESREVKARVHLYEGDMRNFRLERKFPLAIIPFRPMQHMYTVNDQVDALRTAALHLADNGILAFDVFYPKFEMLLSGIGQEVLEFQWPHATNAMRVVRRFFRKDSVDKIQQIFSFTFLVRTYEGERVVMEETASMSLGFYTYPHLRALFQLAGLQIIEEYGSFNKSPLDNAATEMIFLLKKTTS